jgi:hypothetical protein
MACVLFGCSASQMQVFQKDLFAWDDANFKTASDFAVQIKKHWDYNYKFVEEFLGGKLNTEDYFMLKIQMDKIKNVEYTPGTEMNEEDVAIINVAFGKFITIGGEKLIKDGLPQFMKFVSEFKIFFGI